FLGRQIREVDRAQDGANPHDTLLVARELRDAKSTPGADLRPRRMVSEGSERRGLAVPPFRKNVRGAGRSYPEPSRFGPPPTPRASKLPGVFLAPSGWHAGAFLRGAGNLAGGRRRNHRGQPSRPALRGSRRWYVGDLRPQDA